MDGYTEYMGNWFLPETPDRKASGTLKVTEGRRFVLEIIGSLREITGQGDDPADVKTTTKILFGTACNGDRITLYGQFITGADYFIPELRFPGLRRFPDIPEVSTLSADYVFVGAHFETEEQIKFKKLTVSYSSLDEWLSLTGFSVDEGSRQKIAVSYEVQESVQVAELNGYRVIVGSKASGEAPRPNSREFKIKETLFVTFDFTEPRQFGDCLRVIYQFANFLALAMGQPVYALTMEGEPAEGGEIPIVTIHFKHEPKSGAKWLFSEMLFSYDDAKARMQELLQSWLSKEERLKPVYNLYFGALYSPSMNLYHTFSSLAQAVETFHSRTMAKAAEPTEEYKKVMQEILNTVPEQHKGLVERAIAPRVFLRDKLRDLLADSTGTLRAFIADEDDFIAKIVDTRNYLTHYGRKSNNVVEGDDLIFLTHKLKVLLEERLLRTIGFTKDEVEPLIAMSCSRIPQLF